MKNELITFKDGTLELNVPVSWEQETVWLTRSQMAKLFERDVKTIGKHINNALKEELDRSTVANFATFLDKNGVLFIDDEKQIDDHTLVALTIMIAESKPEEKEMMITVVMNCLRP